MTINTPGGKNGTGNKEAKLSAAAEFKLCLVSLYEVWISPKATSHMLR